MVQQAAALLDIDGANMIINAWISPTWMVTEDLEKTISLLVG
ncbi:hypothetical protein [Paenibacillus qinlingensis]|nr:hypothetical protein [Paenibacillus qinlingensis]